jgi:hypothetical protein
MRTRKMQAIPTQGVFMKPHTSTNLVATVALALGVLATATTAHARSDVSFSIGVQVPGVYVQSAPVYVRPMPFYAPAPEYHWRHDGPNWQRGGAYGDHGRPGFASAYGPGNQPGQWHQMRRYGPHGDLDRDGVMNRFDHDRDGDGIRNRYDRLPSRPDRR